MGVGKNTINTIMGEIGKYQESIKPEIQSLKQQQALYPDFKFGDPTTGPDYTVSATGVKKGDQVTKTVPVKVTTAPTGGTQTTDQNKYMADLAKRFPGASGEELAKKRGDKGSYISKSMIDKYNKEYYKPKTVTTGTPDQEVTVTAPIPQDADQSNENDGSSAADTKPDTVDDTTETPDGKAGPNEPIFSRPTGTSGSTKFNRSSVNPNPTLATKGTGKDVHHELSLVNMQTSKA